MLFFVFLIINFKILISEAIAQIFIPIAELVIARGIPSKETKAEIEIHQVIVKAKTRKFSI